METPTTKTATATNAANVSQKKDKTKKIEYIGNRHSSRNRYTCNMHMHIMVFTMSEYQFFS